MNALLVEPLLLGLPLPALLLIWLTGFLIVVLWSFQRSGRQSQWQCWLGATWGQLAATWAGLLIALFWPGILLLLVLAGLLRALWLFCGWVAWAIVREEPR